MSRLDTPSSRIQSLGGSMMVLLVSREPKSFVWPELRRWLLRGIVCGIRSELPSTIAPRSVFLAALVSHGDDDLALSLSRLQVADRIGNLAQRERPVDDRRDLPAFDELLQDDQAVSRVLGPAERMQMAHEG
jgi:hypothetical protein